MIKKKHTERGNRYKWKERGGEKDENRHKRRGESDVRCWVWMGVWETCVKPEALTAGFKERKG